MTDNFEVDLVPWFERSLDSFKNYDYPFTTHRLNQDVDPHSPTVWQLARKHENGSEIEHTTHYACKYNGVCFAFRFATLAQGDPKREGDSRGET